MNGPSIRRLPDERLQLNPARGSQPDAPARCELSLDGRAAPQPLPGAVLEAAFECEGAGAGRYLLFLTDGVPDEDFLHLHLLDAQLALLDSASLGAMYSTGSFALLAPPGPLSLGFRFIGDTDWAVELLQAPALRLPLVGEPRGVHRRFGFQRHFRIHGQPRPQGAG